LGGHEFHPDGAIRGFDDDFDLAVTPGHVFNGFGGDNREKIVRRALDLGINLFDITIDSEKEAMGRLLQKIKPSGDILIQTRPEGMVYAYDPANKMMADFQRLRQEVVRILNLLQRETIDIFNFAFMQDALDADPDYMEKIGYNIKTLKKEGLIRFASADTFSGQAVYLKQIESGYFDSTFINYNPTEKTMEDQVIPAAAARSMAILGREIFRKGQLFKMADEAHLSDYNAVARAAIKWTLQNSSISSIVLGVSSAEQLEENLSTLANLELTPQDHQIITAICATEEYKREYQKRRAEFLNSTTP
jgi:aryl-alcohol dehydrogenase-like predicted oxidoreductase